MFPGLRNAELAGEKTADLLSNLLPEIMATLPDWTDVRAGSWPPDRPDRGVAASTAEPVLTAPPASAPTPDPDSPS